MNQKHNNEIIIKQLLSKREYEILDVLSKGLTYKEMSERLFISPETVKKHLKNIYKKLGVHNKTIAIQRFAELKNTPSGGLI